jgi:Tol biopolymer transport system component
LIWDVEGGSIRKIIPGGVDGKYSPDGDILAFVTIGAVSNNSENDKLLPGGEPFLQLMDMTDRGVFLSLPVYAFVEKNQFIPEIIKTDLTFSPDGRYLAFYTYGEVYLDERGWPVGSSNQPKDVIYLNIIDLTEKKLVFHARSSALGWSPDGHQIVFADPDDNWYLFDFTEKRETRLTLHGGRLRFPRWSPDGKYLSFELRQAGDPDSYRFSTVIIDLSNGAHTQ